MKPFNLVAWLRAHSTGVERIGAELVFTHISGETSVLLPRDNRRNSLLAVRAEPLASFYEDYFGASVGNSQLTFATNVVGGLEVSHGFKLLDFDQMAVQARGLGVSVGAFEQVFLAEAAWMFIYTVSKEAGQTVLRVYDRDYGTSKIIDGLDAVFTAWWSIVENDLPAKNEPPGQP
jgi:hypothetical protein